MRGDTLADLALTLAVLTCRRPADLRAVLPTLLSQIAQVKTTVRTARIVVVDNSPDGDAEGTVRTIANEHGPDGVLDYVHEPVPGIAAARNRALAESTTSDLLVFIDDDERPTDTWLALLLATYAGSEAVAVVGPVVSEFETPPSPWVAAGRFFDRRRLPTGTTLAVAATNNLLMDLRVVRAAGLTFDTRMGLVGGEDTLFTRVLARHGRMVWCDEALVVDVVPRARVGPDWVVRRALRSGNSWALTTVQLAESRTKRVQARVGSAGSGLTRLAGGSVQLVVGVAARSLTYRARAVRTLARGAGMVLGACGVSYREYQRPGQGRRIAMARW